ncbi:hypothetical protein AMECASPLE_029632 [Ameca splendens]|uniref:Uncharacterized protein n=1 Tax=Ameca splendens TaxID=208324 RepID=A0ABV0XIV9_9TELE
MDVQLTKLQQLCNAHMSIWTIISEKCFRLLVDTSRSEEMFLNQRKVPLPQKEEHLAFWITSASRCGRWIEDEGVMCSNTDASPVCFVEERADPRNKALDLHSGPH